MYFVNYVSFIQYLETLKNSWRYVVLIYELIHDFDKLIFRLSLGYNHNMLYCIILIFVFLLHKSTEVFLYLSHVWLYDFIGL